MYVLIAFFTPLLYALSCIVDAHFSNAVFKKTSSLVFYATISNMLIIPFLFFFGIPVVPPFEVLAILFVIAFIEVFYQIPYYLSLRRIDTSIVVALFSLGKIVLPILAYLIVDEKLALSQYVGFGIIVASTFILNFDVRKCKLNIAFFLMLLVSVLLSLVTVLSKYSLQHIDFVTVLFWMSLFASLISCSFLLFKNTRDDIVDTFPRYRKKVKLFLFNEMLSQGGFWIMILSLAHLPVLTVEAISSSQSIFALFLGGCFYKFGESQFREDFQVKNVAKKLSFFTLIIWGICLVVI